MANQKGQHRITLLSKLTFAPEARSAEGNPPIIEGRFRYFWDTFKRNNNYLMLANLFLLIFFLPLIVALVLPNIFGGMEGLSYFLKKTTKLPYYMSNIGIGISQGQDVLAGRLAILEAYHFYLLICACALPFTSFGLAGMFHIAIKFIWQDSFIYKKDSYGNHVPRIVKEFFIGVKNNWLQYLIVMTAFALIFAGVASSFVFFIRQYWQGLAGGGEWVLIIFASIIALFPILLLIYMLPMIPMYKLPLISKFKNSFLLIITMLVPSLFIAAISAVPFLLSALLGGFLKVIIIALILVFGGGFYSVMWCNFVQFHAEKIITPVYEANKNKGKKKKKNK